MALNGVEALQHGKSPEIIQRRSQLTTAFVEIGMVYVTILCNLDGQRSSIQHYGGMLTMVSTFGRLY